MVSTEMNRRLWQDLKLGSHAALEQIYQLHFESLSRYGYRIVQDAEKVEDAIQDVFLNLWRRREFLGEVERIKFYLFKALRNQLSRNIRHDLFEEAEDINDFLDYLSTISAEQQSINQETREATAQIIQQALAGLSNRQREAIHLRFYQGLSLDETAEMMGLPKQVVKNLLCRSYVVLRVSLRVIISWAIMLLWGY